MTISTQSLISELREHTGIDEEDLDNDGCLLLLNRSFWELCNKVNFKEKERTVIITTADGVRKYHKPVSLDSVVALNFVDPDTEKRVPLTRIGTWTYDNKYEGNTDARGRPEEYYREENYIVLHPTPDAAYSVELRHKRTLEDLEDDNNAPIIPQEWHEIILMGAVTRTFLRFKDYKSAREAREFQSSISNGTPTVDEKEQEDSHKAHFEVEGYEDYL
jgi:hypothetical protein